MKRYVITGSLGHISKPIAEGLVKAGKDVTIITSSNEKVKEIEAIGAKAIVGSLSDPAFVKDAFKGAEVVYTMVPPIWQTNNWRASQDEIISNYVGAIKANNIKYVVNLSSIGAHLGKGTGPVNALHFFENDLNNVPGLNVKHLRPSSFYYNLLSQIPMIKHAGIMGANYGDEKIALVDTRDIAKVALEELMNISFTGNSVRYIVSDLRTGNEIVGILGKSINKEMPWVVFTDEQQLKGMIDGGVPPGHASAFTEMGAAIRNGKMQEDVINQPATGSIKLEDFAKEFAAAYNS
ncbi:NmrA family NAD(P)-binding protein [soil metagenome]